MSGARRRSLAVVGLLLLAGPAARAQKAGSAEAEELFQQGRAALAAHDYERACTQFAQSLELERAVGTLISLAECEEARNLLTSARQHWQEAADLADAKNDALHRGPVARQRFADLDRRVPRVTVRLSNGAPRDAVLQRDDVALGSGSFDVPLPVDPGRHVIAIRAPGREDRSYEMVLAPGEHKTLEAEPGPIRSAADDGGAATAAHGGTEPTTAELDAGLTAAIAGPISGTIAGSAGGSGPSESGASGSGAPGGASGNAQRAIGWVVGGLGIAGVAVGSYFGLRAFSQWANAKDQCGSGCPAGSDARNERGAALSAATGSTIAFAAGGAAIAAGIVFLVTAPTRRVEQPSRVTLAPVVDAHGSKLVVQGTW